MTSTAPATPGSIAADVVRRLPKAAVIVLGLIVLPAAVGGLLGGPAASAGLVIGLLGGVLGSMARGYVVARAFLPMLAAGLVVGGVTTGTWWWVVAATGFAGLAGWSLSWGLMPLFSVAAIFMVTAKPLDGFGQVVIAFVFVLLGGLLGSEVARRSGTPARVPGKPEPRSRAAGYAVALAGAVAVAATVGHLLDSERGYWIPMTVLILAQPAPQGHGRKTRDRLLGTILGFIVLAPIALLDLPRPVLSVLAVLSVLLVVAVSAPYWLRVLFVTTTVVLVLAPPDSAFAFASRRLGETAIGVLIIAVAGLALLWWARHHTDPVTLPAVDDVS